MINLNAGFPPGITYYGTAMFASPVKVKTRGKDLARKLCPFIPRRKNAIYPMGEKLDQVVL